MSASKINRWAKNTFIGHKERGFNFEDDVTISKLRELMRANLNKRCIYCAKLLSWNNEEIYRPTLDVINPQKPVTMDNLQIICSQCNVMKSRKTHSQFLVFRQTPEYLRQVKCPEGSFPGKFNGRVL